MTKVLLVAPRKDEADLLRASLTPREAEGAFDIHHASDVESAVRVLGDESFDVVVADLGGGTDGPTLDVPAVETLVAAAPDTPAIVLVDSVHEWRALAALRSGARDYLVKRARRPVLLARVIAHTVERSRLEDHLAEVHRQIADLEARAVGLFGSPFAGLAWLDGQGTLLDVNARFAALLSTSRDALIGRRLADLGVAPGRSDEWGFLPRLSRSASATFAGRRALRAGDGAPVAVDLHVARIRRASGLPVRLALHAVTSSGAPAAAVPAAAPTLEVSFRGVLESAPVAMVILDDASRVVMVNAHTEELFGYGREVLAGEPVTRILPEFELLRGPGDTDATPSPGPPGRGVEYDLLGRRRDATTLPCDVRVRPLVAEQGLLTIVAVVDVTERVRTRAAMRRTEEQFRAVFDSTAVGITIVDLHGVCISANAAFERILGYRVSEMVGTRHSDLVYPEDVAIGVQQRSDLLAGRLDRYETERRYLHKDGHPVWLRVSSSLVRNAAGEPEVAVGVSLDITEQKSAEEALRQRTVELLALVGSAANDAGSIEDALRMCIAHVCDKLGWPVGHALFPGPHDVLLPSPLWHLDDPERYAGFRSATMELSFASGFGIPGRALEMKQPVWMPDLAGEMWTPRHAIAARAGLKSCVCFPVVVGTEVAAALEFFSTTTLQPDPALREAVNQVGTQLGRVIERMRLESYMRFHAMHDALTTLPNRTLFMDRLRQALARLERHPGTLAVLFLDVDGFKDVNDELGHGAGDALLSTIAMRVREVVRPGDTVARIGGDEFTVLCEDIGGLDEAEAVAQRALEAVERPVELKDAERTPTLSIGIALARDAGVSPDHLLRNADTAMYRAKERGGSRVETFDAALRRSVQSRRMHGNALRHAIDREQMRIFYQPSVSLRGGAVEGVEALVRWDHPERGLVEPGEIIPIAEDMGLIESIGAWVLERACEQAVRWRARLPRRAKLAMAVNLSSRQFTGALTGIVRDVLRRTGMDPAGLCLEITESVMLEDSEAAVAQLEELQALGVDLVIDDFGTGYSSLSYLQRMPIACVKLDRAFAVGLGRGPQTHAIVAAVVNLAHALHLSVVAEGVETAQQLDDLRDLGCDSAQGFYFARPQPAIEMEAFLKAEAPPA
ncbi:MAG TPA: EAL domain-containing protein [Candidatus Saccharimonadaceae bacterium]|nr:EAL domain-containing protein [Candidatus Saccharimonadaceae bacterium]